MLPIDEALMECQVAIILVDHDEFKMIPFASRRHLDVIDTRGIWQDMPKHDPGKTWRRFSERMMLQKIA
jgi:UDP-N-acetyl-D-mannosaminuronate dehydrogenase